MSKDGTKDIWDGDLLDYKTRSESYTRLIQSIDEGYVLSIESGFGQGKTFFVKNWAAELIQSGETVLKIDAWRSESSGDPIVTFVGKLLEALPDTGKTSGKNLKRAVSVGRNLLVASAKIGVNVVARNAAEEIVDALKSDYDDEDSWGVTALSDATRQAGNPSPAIKTNVSSLSSTN